MDTPAKFCLTCGKEFTDSKHKDRKYCCHECAMKARHKVLIKICPVCGNEFGHDSYPATISKQTYCSKKCEGAARVVKEKETRYCAYCGKAFEAWRYRSTQYCSRACSAKGIKPNRITERVCKTCGKVYLVKPSQIKHRGSSYCSRECMAKGLSIERRAAGNANYRGGSVVYRGRNWGSQKRAAMKRDGYKCQICGKRLNRAGWDYGVHHITPYREFDGDWESANQLSNLITLCRSCHAKVEFGKLPCPKPLL